MFYSLPLKKNGQKPILYYPGNLNVYLIYILDFFKVYFLKIAVLSDFSQEKEPFDPGFLPKWP